MSGPPSPGRGPAVLLVDGEHHPDVTLDAVAALRARGYDIAAAAMLGGGEKLSGAVTLGDVPIVTGPGPVAALRAALAAHDPAVVVDVSDAPVVDNRIRSLLASVALAAGVAYEGAGLRYDPPPRPRLTACATIAVIGTGKRTGKTAVAGELARHAARAGRRVVIVAMGRGGPAEPVVTRAAPSLEDLLALADAGRHAASDNYEDAVLTGVTTVGARRAGAGPAGATVFDTVAAAVEAANAEGPDVIILEGSGTAIPPAEADATLLVVGGGTPEGELIGGLGPYRLLISDLAVVTMAEEPVLRTGTFSNLTSLLNDLGDPEGPRGVPVVRTVFRPAPLAPIAGDRTFVATTAPVEAGETVRTHLEEVHGATIAGITHRLSDRPQLLRDLAAAEGTYDVMLTEIKAAGIDVAARTARAAGARVVFLDNRPEALDGSLPEALDDLIALADRRAGTTT